MSRSSIGLRGGYVLYLPTYREMTTEKSVHPLRSSPPGRYLTKSRQILQSKTPQKRERLFLPTLAGRSYVKYYPPLTSLSLSMNYSAVAG